MTDLEALAAYGTRRDPEAFRQLVLAYQSMVYCTCRRILDQDADAEDATQETFIKLAKAAGQVRLNPAAWLHTCAANSARDRLRANKSRQTRETEWAEMHEIETKDDWNELLPVVDECIAGLPEDDRELLLEHYFAGRTQTDLAAQHGVSQPAIKKRLDRIVDDLRGRLHKMGYAVPIGLLMAFLSQRACDAAVPGALTAALVKIGVAGVGEGVGAGTAAGSAAASAAGTPILGTLVGKIAVGVAAVVVAGAAALVFTGVMGKAPQPPPESAAQPSKTERTETVEAQPKTPAELVVLNGHDYELRWVTPGELRQTPLHELGTCEVRAAGPQALYAAHVDPLYNIHVQLVEGGQEEAEALRKGREWGVFWAELAESLAGKVERFAIAAYAGGKLAGHVRFFPADAARINWLSSEYRTRRSDVLLIGAGCVDLQGAEDGLDSALLLRVADYARERGYARIQAVGWSAIRPYAMWAESLPAAAYEAAGFRRAAMFDAPAGDAFHDMLAGAHGAVVQRMTKAALAGGIAEDQASRVYLVEYDTDQEGIRTVEKDRAAGRETAAKVKRDGNKVWVDGVPALGWDKHQCTFAAALEAATAVTERPVTYTHIMGVTGLAFRTRWFQGRAGQKWCPSSPVGEFPEEIEAVQKATGWPLIVVCEPENLRMERFAKDIAASIDAGRPVPAYEPGLNVDVIYGYKDAGRTMLLKDFFKGEIELPAEKLGWMLFLLQDPTDPLSAREALAQGLRIAERNWRRKSSGEQAGYPNSEKGDYLFGDAALAQWAEDLGEVDALNEADRGNLLFVSGWCFSSMWDARAEAARFLSANAGVFDGEARAAILRAAEIYRLEANLLKDIVTVANKAPDARARERSFLAEARKLEAAAIAEIVKALAGVK